jgi:sugar phosphate isomerase/epimerase
MITLGLAFSGGRVPPPEAVERTAALRIGSTAIWADLAEGPAALRAPIERARALGLEVLGLNAYANLVHPVPATRRWNVQAVRAVMTFAAELGVPWVNTMAGTRDPALAFWAYHPDNFGEPTWRDLVGGVQELLAGTPSGVRLTLEPYMLTPLSTTAALRRVLDDVAHPRLGVALDPVNLIEPREYHDSAGAIDRMFAALGDRIVSVQAKDHFMHRLKATVQIDERVPGDGELPYPALLRAMAQLEPAPQLVIEHLRDDDQIVAARDFIRRTAAEAGVALA